MIESPRCNFDVKTLISVRRGCATRTASHKLSRSSSSLAFAAPITGSWSDCKETSNSLMTRILALWTAIGSAAAEPAATGTEAEVPDGKPTDAPSEAGTDAVDVDVDVEAVDGGGPCNSTASRCTVSAKEGETGLPTALEILEAAAVARTPQAGARRDCVGDPAGLRLEPRATEACRATPHL